ncbi:hypothetical protein N185_17290 [Sinorhizobium sp. GW3]|nr:hypothetical protein N185_17290 [Sinorhizobium sp. GW3]
MVLLAAVGAKPVGFVQQVSNGGGLPISAASFRWLSHKIQFSGNFAERQIGIGNGDRRQQLHQMVVRRASWGPRQEVLIRVLFTEQAMNGATKALDGPAAAIEHPHDILPTVLGPELLHQGQPRPATRREPR